MAWGTLWLDSGLTFVTHVRERVNKAQAAEARSKSLTRTYELPRGLVRKIQSYKLRQFKLLHFLELRYASVDKKCIKKKFINYRIDKDEPLLVYILSKCSYCSSYE